MLDLSSPYASFIIIFYVVGLVNLVQGVFFSYKYINGFGAIFPREQLFKNFTSGKRYATNFSNLIVSPDKATKNHRLTLLAYIILMFLSVFILLQLVRQVK